MLDVRNRLRGREGLLLAGDLVCFLLVAAVGLRSHEETVTPLNVLRAAAPFQLAWLFVHFALASQVREATATRQASRLWVPAWALGLVLRTLLFGRAFSLPFAIVALLVNGVLLMLWRGLLAPIVLRR